jgi:putative peptide zinc metalloprotease protein
LCDVDSVAAAGDANERSGGSPRAGGVRFASGFDAFNRSAVEVTAACASHSDPVEGFVRQREADKKPAPASYPAPVLAEGVELLGEYRDSGYSEPQYLARRADGQMIQLPRPLFVVAKSIDGRRDTQALAERASAALGRRLSADAVRFLIEEKLSPIGLVDRGWRAKGQGPLPRARPLLALATRRTLVPARWVNRVAGALVWLFTPIVATGVLVALTAAGAWFLLAGGRDSAAAVLVDPTLILAVYGIMWASAVIHEFGHATACRYSGGHPGRIGLGIFIVWPALFTNVTDSYRLSRRGRVRTDLGGVYFSALSIVALVIGYAATSFPALAAAAVLVAYVALIQLLPFVRLDGYFVVGDLLGIPDPMALVRPALASLLRRRKTNRALRPRVRLAVGVWLGLALPCVTAVLLMILLGLPHLASISVDAIARETTALEAAVRAGDPAATGLDAIVTFMLLLPPLCVGVLLVRVAARFTRAALRSSQGRPLRLAAYVAVAAGFVGLVTLIWALRGDVTFPGKS